LQENSGGILIKEVWVSGIVIATAGPGLRCNEQFASVRSVSSAHKVEQLGIVPRQAQDLPGRPIWLGRGGSERAPARLQIGLWQASLPTVQKRKQSPEGASAKLKEIRVRPKTGDHDVRHEDQPGAQVSRQRTRCVERPVRGRELQHLDEGRRIIVMMVERLTDLAKIGKPRRWRVAA